MGKSLFTEQVSIVAALQDVVKNSKGTLLASRIALALKKAKFFAERSGIRNETAHRVSDFEANQGGAPEEHALHGRACTPW
jgi:hypothetical protein